MYVILSVIVQLLDVLNKFIVVALVSCGVSQLSTARVPPSCGSQLKYRSHCSSQAGSVVWNDNYFRFLAMSMKGY
jgi:hypothetical protein